MIPWVGWSFCALQPDIESEHVVTVTIPARLKRAGMEMRLLIDGAGGGARTKADRSLCRLLAQAYRFQSLLLTSRGKTMTEVAEEAGVTYPYFRRILTVSFLAPDIVQAVLRNRHPIELNARQLSQNTILPLSWDAQRSVLGLD
jgi:site-specific DNA recombinase